MVTDNVRQLQEKEDLFALLQVLALGEKTG